MALNKSHNIWSHDQSFPYAKGTLKKFVHKTCHRNIKKFIACWSSKEKQFYHIFVFAFILCFSTINIYVFFYKNDYICIIDQWYNHWERATKFNTAFRRQCSESWRFNLLLPIHKSLPPSPTRKLPLHIYKVWDIIKLLRAIIH